MAEMDDKAMSQDQPGLDQASYAATYAAVMEANIAVHGHMAADYKAYEPHYRPENVAKVREVLTGLVERSGAKKVLDLGCGTGFLIDLLRPLVDEVHGVDITQEMLDQVERGGPGARVTLTNSDTATFDPGEGAFDLVTSYSFLHHLFDVEPTFRTAAKALRPGGQYYADLEPNHAFWAVLGELEPGDSLDPLVRAEVEKVRFKDHEVAGQLGVSKEMLDKAEYGKNVTGGFAHDRLVATLKRAGFSKVEVFYHWFLGQAQIINQPGTDREVQAVKAAQIDEVLQRALPLSRSMYKYLGFIATK
jgi:SAM-dependent methyltransferase